MTIFTIELPEELAARLSAVPESERNNFAVSALAVGLNTLSAAEAADQAWWDGLTTKEQEASRHALARSLEDADAGRVRPAEEVFARIRTKYADSADREAV